MQAFSDLSAATPLAWAAGTRPAMATEEASSGSEDARLSECEALPRSPKGLTWLGAPL